MVDARCAVTATFLVRISIRPSDRLEEPSACVDRFGESLGQASWENTDDRRDLTSTDTPSTTSNVDRQQ